jgi:hypothetical protein
VGLVLEVLVDTFEFYLKTGVRCKLLCNAGFFMVIQSVSTIFATGGFFLMLEGAISTHINIKYRGTITAHDIFFDMGELTVFTFLTLAASMLGLRILTRARKEEAWPEGYDLSKNIVSSSGGGNDEAVGKEMQNIQFGDVEKEDPWK